MRILASIIIIAFLLSSCAPVMINAPAREDVKLLSEADVATYKTTKRCWYFLWGLVPISDHSTAEIIAKHGLKNIRAKSYYSAVDFLIDCLTGGVLTTWTVEVEGNTK
jgi:hypothetical protein